MRMRQVSGPSAGPAVRSSASLGRARARGVSHFGQRAGLAAHDRGPAKHRFEDGNSEAFCERCEDERFAGREEHGQVLVVDISKELDPVLDAEIVGQLD